MRMRSRALAAVFALVVASCGYRPLVAHDTTARGGEPASGRLAVVRGVGLAPYPAAADALVGAFSSRLAEARELRSGEGYPRVEIELLRVDELAEGIAEVGGSPLGRGVRIVVVGRARVVRAPGEEPAFDTGDVSANVVASASGPAASALVVRDEAAVGAARALGRRLAERVLGLPAPTDEGRGNDF